MFTQEHINWYLADIQRAKLKALDEIQKARRSARQAMCPGCAYCNSITKHKHVLEQTIEELSVVLYSLSPGLRSYLVFQKTMYHDHNIYRGFIADTGDYLPIHFTDHSEFRKEYASIFGEERAYRMINIQGRSDKTKVLFCDRKAAPSYKQYTTLRELMIDAEGALSFHFEFETTHPQAK